jgi:hypothetical protein
MAQSTDVFKAMIRDYAGSNLSDQDCGRGQPQLDRVGIDPHDATVGIHTAVGSKVPAQYVPEVVTDRRG